MDIQPIRTEADYEAALRDIETYFDREPEPGSAKADRFDVLATLIEAYERERWHRPTGPGGSHPLLHGTARPQPIGPRRVARFEISRIRDP